MRQRNYGLTLIDLLVVIAVLAVIVSMASPVTNWIAKQQLRSAHSELLLAINYARFLALSTGRPVTLCALHGSNKCQNPWQGELTVFTDPNRALGLDESAEVHRVIQVSDSVDVQWRGMNPNHSIRFAPTGLTFVSNGTFTITHKAIAEPKRIIVNRQGRARTE